MKKIADRTTMIRLHEQAIRDCMESPPREQSWRYIIRSTSGTTESGPLHVLYEFGPEAPDRFVDSRRVLLCMGQLGVRLTNVVTIRRSGADRAQKILCADPRMLEEDTEDLIGDFAPDMVFGMASFVLAVMQRMRAACAAAVRTVMLTGEYVTSSVTDIFSRLSPGATIAQVYATSETGMIAKVACGHLPLNAYHPLDDVTVEIDEPNESGVGRVLIGKKFYKNIGVERYQLGDIGSLSFNECACGDPRTLRLYGRTGADHLKLAGALLHKEEFDRVAALCADYFDDYRAEARAVLGERGTKGHITLKVYRADGTLDSAAQRALIERFSGELFLTPTQTLADLVQKGIFLPLELQIVSEPFVYRGKPTKLVLSRDH